MKPTLAAILRLPVDRLVPWVALIPIPAWFLFSAVFAAPAAWRAVYRAGVGEPVAIETFEPEMSHLWSGKYFAEVPGQLDSEDFVAEFDACLNQTRDATVPFMLVSDGAARFALDGVLQLSTPAEPRSERQVSGKPITLSAGRHYLRLDFQARKRPSIGLLASFDGQAPQALGSGELVQGTTVFRPRPGSNPCGD